MHNFQLQFAYEWAPWLFLLLIPALGITLFLYFRLNKRFRRTRNRVISIVLHMLVMMLCISVLTGVTFTYEIANLENEIILLVDVSDTEETARETRDAFVSDVLEKSGYDGFKVGLVTFGFTQRYAVPLTYETDSIYDAYCLAPLPDDTSATDIAAALRYTQTLFENPETSKIVLITDGIETDETAINEIRSISAKGTKVDIAYIPSSFDDTVFIEGVVYPDYHVGVGETCKIGVTLQSSAAQTVSVDLTDNGSPAAGDSRELIPGSQTVYFDVAFSEEGLHELAITVRPQEDSLRENDRYFSYYDLKEFKKVLIVEYFEGQSAALSELLGAEDYEVDVLNLQTDENIPRTVDELRAYDQIVLNNVANADLPKFEGGEGLPAGFDELLYSYVYEYGGGLFTVGGNDEEDKAHAYNRVDLNNTLYQQMLPVQAIDYTPPVGVIVIIDISGSMESEGAMGLSKKEWAVQGAYACLGALTERDYFGLMTLDTYYGTILTPTRTTEQVRIREAIDSVKEKKGGATNFADAIDHAGQALSSLPDVDRRHIILVTDGMPGESANEYLPIVQGYYNTAEITVSTVGIDMSAGDTYAGVLEEIATVGHGRTHILTDESRLLSEMHEDLNVPEIKEVNAEPFRPRIENERSPLLDGVQMGEEEDRRVLDVELGGFYGVRARPSADLVLVGEYEVPIYAQWKVGKGTVGSFMCDLNGTWSYEFMHSDTGKRFLMNVIENLMPIEDLRPNEIPLRLREENYINQLSIPVSLEEGETIRARIEGVGQDGPFSVSLNEIAPAEQSRQDVYVTVVLGPENFYSRCNFVLKTSGVFRIIVEKTNAAGEVVASRTIYKSFAYSAEYSPSESSEVEMRGALSDLAKAGEGVLIADNEDPYEIFANFKTSIPRSFDPRWLFISIALCLFLLDIAVRKFKFKWIHELVREHREKRAKGVAK